MSYAAYREDSSRSESEEEEDSLTTSPQFDTISGDSSSDPASPTPSLSNDDADYTEYLTGPGSQMASYVSKMAKKCNVAQLKRILTEYGVRGLSKARKPFLIKKAVECHNRLEDTMKKRFQATLADPAGKEGTVTSTIHDDSPEQGAPGGRTSRSSNSHNQRSRKPAPASSPDYSNEEEEEDYNQPEIAPPRRSAARALRGFPPTSDSESSNSRSSDVPDHIQGRGSSNRGRIVLTLPKMKTGPLGNGGGSGSSSRISGQASTMPSSTGYERSTEGAPSAQLLNKSPIRPYVPRAGLATSVVASAWPPPLPVEDKQRKRSADHFGAGAEGASLSPGRSVGHVSSVKRPVLNAQPSMLHQVTLPSPYIPTSSHGQSSYNYFPSQGAAFPMYTQIVQPNGLGTASQNVGSSSSQMSGLVSRSSSQLPTRYQPTFSTANNPYQTNGVSFGQVKNLSSQESEYARITHLMRSLSDDPAMSPQPRRERDFQPASTIQLASREPRPDPRAGYSNGLTPLPQRHSVIHPYQGTSVSDPSAARVITAAQHAVRHQQQQQQQQASSIMSNNPFAAAFKTNQVPAPPPRQNSDELEESRSSESKMLKFKVEWPSIPSEDHPSAHGGRVIKAPVFHETLWQVREPLSIRRDQTLTTRGVYREIIMTFYFNQNNVTPNDQNTVVLFRFCQESANLTTAYEMHPDNLKLMLNGKTLVEPAVVDFSNRMKKKKNAVFNQPIEVNLNLLAAQNVVLVRWTEDGAQTGQPAPSVPDEPPKDYYLIVECARRKSMEDILQTVSVNRVPTKDTVYKLYQTLGGGDDDIVTDSQRISLHCPASRSRLTIPVRGRNCDHIDCFDVSSFLFMNKSQKARWTCPKCNKSVQFDEIVVDEFMQALLTHFPGAEGIEATLENREIVVRESKKPQKSESSRNTGETANKNVGSTLNPSTPSSSSSSTSNKPPPEVITLD